jgi:hypothetical protein
VDSEEVPVDTVEVTDAGLESPTRFHPFVRRYPGTRYLSGLFVVVYFACY